MIKYLTNLKSKSAIKGKNLFYPLILIFIFISIWITFFSEIPSQLFSPKQMFRGEFSKFIITIIGGILLYYGLLLNARRTEAIEVQNKIALNGQVNERFNNAIEHLGSESPAIVLGGIYALHHIALEEYSYRKSVFDILCSFIRDKTAPLKEWKDYSEEERKILKPDILIQTIINLIFKPTNENYLYQDLKADLAESKCLNYDFSDSILIGANFKHSDFSGSNFKKASLIYSNLISSCFQDTDFEGATLSKSRIQDAHFEFAYLRQIELKNSTIINSHFEFADFYKSKMQGSYLRATHLEGCFLSNANLIGMKFQLVNFNGADLSKTHLEGSYFHKVQFKGADLSEVYFEGCHLGICNLKGADVINSNFDSATSINLIKHTEYNFIDWINKRVGQKSELDRIILGKLDNEEAEKLISEQREWDREDDISSFVVSIENATTTEINIEDLKTASVLTKEQVEKIMVLYNS